MPRRPSPQTPFPAPLKEAPGVPRPAERLSPSSLSWAVPWTSSLCDMATTPPEEGIQGASGTHPSHLIPLTVEEQLFSKLLLDSRAPHPISKEVLRGGSSFQPLVSEILFFR
ncbi:hypothetical protein ILYODFUR_032662 [Ilyodon furcidens]|uniref:Uncharacterized protein n=1 Tax=Ilyodon furcidens TaxID=33524 RepID=A0ABV0U095_9TELE